jgi:hypothetical protein
MSRDVSGTYNMSTSQPLNRVPVTAENFVRAESDLYFSMIVKEGGFGKFEHHRDLTPIDGQTVVRQNRDTLYSAAIFDLDAGSVIITLPDPTGRFMSMQIISEDEYSPPTVYAPCTHTLTKENVGTRYVLAGIRTLVNPADTGDMQIARALQDAINVDQSSLGAFEIPNWDPVSQKNVREALLVLSSTVGDTRRAFGRKEDVDPILHFVAAASTWGGNPPKDAMYLNVVPSKNDGRTIYRLTVKDVPVDGFWSISVYNAQGYFEKNQYDAYTINNITAKRSADGSVVIQFGGCDGKLPNCLPTTSGWNYMVRLYRPRTEILDGSWTFPQAQAM